MTRPDPLPLPSDSDPQEPDWALPSDQTRGVTPTAEGQAAPAASPEAAAPPAPPPPPPEPVAVPINWLVDNGSPPIRYRSLLELARVAPVPDRLASLIYGYPPAITLALSQRPEGTWNNAMLAVPAPRSADFEGVGTIVAYRRLLEYGWDRDAPPLFHARRMLFRLLAEDSDPNLLFELAEKGKMDDESVRRSRVLLRDAAAAALAQAGYEGDPRLRGAALRLLHRVTSFVRSPLASDPWTGAPGKRTLPPGAAPPSYFFLLMLAYMPLFRLEHAGEMDDLLKYLTNQSSEAAQGNHGGAGSHRYLVTGDPLSSEEVAQGDIPFAVSWLELAARLGFLKRHASWSAVFSSLLAQCDESCVWRGRRGQIASRQSHAFVWPSFPLDANVSADDQAGDVTFRLALIARHSGRPLEFV